jgi:hypothetical protein
MSARPSRNVTGIRQRTPSVVAREPGVVDDHAAPLQSTKVRYQPRRWPDSVRRIEGHARLAVLLPAVRIHHTFY